MKIKLVPWMREASGSSGDTVFREVNGETIVASRPGKRKTPFSESQLDTQERFLDARDYADKAKRVPALLALYEQAAEATGKSVYMLCRDDWYNPPTVKLEGLEVYNGRVGDPIKFKVRNVIAIARAIVTLSDDNTGTQIERGEAVVEVEGTNFWMYTATKPVPAGVTVAIRVQVYDHPGNMGQATDSKQIVE